jgi:hypothetical protein
MKQVKNGSGSRAILLMATASYPKPCYAHGCQRENQTYKDIARSSFDFLLAKTFTETGHENNLQQKLATQGQGELYR